MSAEEVWGTVAARERGALPEQIEVSRLRNLLKRFGEHKYDCHMKMGHDCSCGWDQVLRTL